MDGYLLMLMVLANQSVDVKSAVDFPLLGTLVLADMQKDQKLESGGYLKNDWIVVVRSSKEESGSPVR